MNLKEIVAKLTGLEARATEQFNAELSELQTAVKSTIAQLEADVATAKASIESLGKEKADLTASVSDITAKLESANGEVAKFNESLTDACLNGKLLDLNLAADATPEAIKAAASAVPVADKFKAYQGALNAAFAKAGLPNNTLPTPPAKSVAGGHVGDGKKMKLSDFRTLSPKEQSDFCAAVRRGEGELVNE